MMILLLAIACILLYSHSVQAELEPRPRAHGQVYVPRDRFTLSGELGLTYERYWGTDREAVDRFTYRLSLGLNGFVVDPRLMTFGVTGLFGQDFTSAATSTIDGLSGWLSIINDRPRIGVLKYFPSPIILRYAYYSFEQGDSQQYGLSMTYRFFEKKRSASQGNNNLNGAEKEGVLSKLFSFTTMPTFYLDYNRYEYNTDSYNSVYDRLSLRAAAYAKHVEYFALYEYEKNSGRFEGKDQLFGAMVNYRNYWKNETRLESYNQFWLEDRDLGKVTRFSDHTIWMKNFGIALRDSVYVSGGGDYISHDTDNAYSLNLGSGYAKYITERFANQSSVNLVYGKDDIDTFHNEAVRSSFQYRLSNRVTLMGDVEVGKNEEATSYAFNIGFSARGRITIDPRYSFSSTGGDIDNIKQHTLYLNLTGPLLRRVSFISQNYYRITDSDSPVLPGKLKTLSLTANLYWSISRYIFSLGGSYTSTSFGDQGGGSAWFQRNDKDTLTTISASMNTFLARRLTLSVTGYAQKHNDEPYHFTLSPYLTWQWRLVTVTARYDLMRRGNSITDHRLYVRMTRTIEGAVRPFF